MSEAVAGLVHEDAAGAGWRIGRITALVLFAAFTAWINYEVKVGMRDAAGTVQALGDLAVGAAAPDFTLSDLEGATVSLAAMRPKNVVLIEFWATWCPPCRMVLTTLRRMEQSLREHGVEVLSVNQGETADEVRHFVEREGAPFRVVLDTDGAVAQRYHVLSLPTMLLIDRQGIVRWIHVGHMPETDDLRDILERLGKE